MDIVRYWVFCSVLLLVVLRVNCNPYRSDDEDEKLAKERCTLPDGAKEDIAKYANVTNQIIDYFINGPYKGKTWKSLADFIDKFGNRPSGSQVLEESIDYMVDLLKAKGLDVHTEELEVPHWTRGSESAYLREPRYKKLKILGLGGSIATPANGITAEAIVVQSFDELNSLSDDTVKGKIIVYAQKYEMYHKTVLYRTRGATKAAEKGAVAALVKSITNFSLLTPHTGMQNYAENVTRIPIAAITVEDADQLLRMQNNKSKIVISLAMQSNMQKNISRNTIADLKGSERENQIVVVSGHIDSWDVGEGALDDGGGAFISWIAPTVLKELNLRPRRTLRTILWTAEEVGLVGAVAYEKAHREENDNLNFVMESDGGTFLPQGLIYRGSKTGECLMREIAKLFTVINASEVVLGNPGDDISVWTKKGIPGGGLKNKDDRYFWYHHSEADTMNVLDSDVLDKCAAFWTGFSYIVADMINNIPRK